MGRTVCVEVFVFRSDAGRACPITVLWPAAVLDHRLVLVAAAEIAEDVGDAHFGVGMLGGFEGGKRVDSVMRFLL